MKYTQKLPNENVNIPKESMLLESLKLLSVLVVIFVFIYFLSSFLLSKAVRYITPEQEIKLVKMTDFGSDIQTIEDKYLQKVADKLVKCTDLTYDINVSILKEDQVNAFAMPGGKIVITKKMLKKIKNENELAFIIGHELGHFKHKDHLQGFGNSLILGIMSLFISENYGKIFDTTLHFSQSKFSQSAEYNADKFGLEVMECAYGNVANSTSLFERMDDGESWKYFMASHPDFTSRVQHMKMYAQQNGFNLDAKPKELEKRY
jgi:Zn-dependent protease with chaperone function